MVFPGEDTRGQVLGLCPGLAPLWWFFDNSQQLMLPWLPRRVPAGSTAWSGEVHCGRIQLRGISRIQGGRLEARPGAFPCRLWHSCGHDRFCIVLSARFSFKTVLMLVVIMQVMFNNRKEREELLEGMLVTGNADTGKQPAFTFTQV